MSFFFALIFILFVFWRPQEWLVPALFGVPILDAVVYMSVLGLLIEIKSGGVEFPRRLPQVWLLIGLFFATVFSHVPHTYFAGIMKTYPDAFKFTFFSLLLICILDSERRFRLVIWIFVALACLMSVHALLQQSRGYGFANQPPLWIHQIGNKPAHTRTLFFGIFSDPNDLAQILTTCIPFSFLLFRTRWLALVAGAAISWLLVLGVLSTHSRGGLLAIAGAGAVMISMFLPTRWFPYLMACMLLGALALCPLSAGFLDASAHDRVVFWGLANEQFKHNLLFGIGYGMFWQVASSMTAHNAFVLCYTEIGLVGYWFWFGLLSLGILGVWRTRQAMLRHPDPEGRWLGFASGMMLASVTGFVASAYFLSRAFVFPMFLLFALMAAMPRIASDRLARWSEEEVAEEGAADDASEEPPQLLETGKSVWMLNTVGTIASVAYVYFSIVLLNKAFYGG